MGEFYPCGAPKLLLKIHFACESWVFAVMGSRFFGHRLSGLLSHQKALSKAGCYSCIASPEPVFQPTSWFRDVQVTTLSSITFNTWKVKMAMVKRKFLFHLGWMIDFKIAVENMKTWLAKVDCKQYTTPS